MNGKPLPLDAPEMKAFTTYIAFLSKDVPVGAQIEGASVLQSTVPNRRADAAAGSVVYDAKCTVCHGADGLGKRAGKRGDAQGYTFPQVWGLESFNNGGGMNRLLTTTRFIRLNMPLGASHAATVLNDDEACDVTALMLSKPRPVKAHLEADSPARWNKPINAAFPPYMLGATADQHRYGPFPPLAELAFTAAQFYGVFHDYNTTLWPVQLLLLALAVAAVILVMRPRAGSGVAVSAILALLWGWMGLAYHLAFFMSVSPPGTS